MVLFDVDVAARELEVACERLAERVRSLAALAWVSGEPFNAARNNAVESLMAGWMIREAASRRHTSLTQAEVARGVRRAADAVDRMVERIDEVIG